MSFLFCKIFVVYVKYKMLFYKMLFYVICFLWFVYDCICIIFSCLCMRNLIVIFFFYIGEVWGSYCFEEIDVGRNVIREKVL